MVKMVNFTLQFSHHNLKYIQLWITALDFTLGVPHPFAAIKAQTSSQDLLPPTANLCAYHTWVTTIIPRSLCILETHPQTHIHLEVTHVETPTRRPVARLMQPVFLEIPATKHTNAESQCDPSIPHHDGRGGDGS